MLPIFSDKATPNIFLLEMEASHTKAVFFLLKTNPAFLLIDVKPGINPFRV